MGKAFDHLSAKISFTLTLRNAPAIMAVIVRNHGGWALGIGRGVRKHGLAPNAAGSKVEDNDAFLIGSAAKPISGYLLALMLKATTFTWQTKIGDVFPELKSAACRRHFNIRDDYVNATIAQIMTHTARFSWAPKFGTALSLGDLVNSFDEHQRAEYCTRRSLMRRRYNYVISSQQDPPAKIPTYNGGPILPVAMMERATGKSYEALMNERVFEELDMNRAGVGRTSTRADPPDGVWYHRYDFTERVPKPNEDRSRRVIDFHAHAPAGGVHFTAADAIKFISAQCKHYSGRRPLKDQWLDETFRHSANGCSVSGWITGADGGRNVSHDGDDGNSYTRIKIWPDKGEGYIVCTNVGGTGPLNNKPDFNFGQNVVNDTAVMIEEMLNNWSTKFPGE